MKLIKKHIKECLQLDNNIKFGKITGNFMQVFLDSGKEVYFTLNDDKTDIASTWYYYDNEITN